MRYRIGEFARLGGATIKALRHYDAIGVLSPAHIDSRTRYRFYVSSQLEDLATIHALRTLGASLDEIRQGLSKGREPDSRRQLLERLRKRARLSLVATQRSLDWLERELEGRGPVTTVSVVLRHRASVHVASIRAELGDYAEIGQIENDLRKGLNDTRIGSLRGVLWHRCAASGAIEGEPFVEIDRRWRSVPGIAVKDLPRATVASAFCESDDETAVRTYDAIDRWIHAHDLELDGPKREIYVGSMLEIQFPVRPGKPSNFRA